MKILEINGFRRWAENYEGDNDVIRYLPRSRKPKEFTFLKAVHDIREILKLSKIISRSKPDIVICQAFGGSYSGGNFRKSCKYIYESILIHLITRMVKRERIPFAVTDVSDDTAIHRVNLPLVRECSLYFKRELPVDGFLAFESFKPRYLRGPITHYRRLPIWQSMHAKLRPLPLGCREQEPVKSPIPVADKATDVFYVGNDRDKPIRKNIDRAFQELLEEGIRVNYPREPLELDDYFEAIRSSKLALSPPGLGWDCHRHYEAAMLGSVPVITYPTIQRDFPLQHKIHCFYYDPAVPLAPQIATMLTDPDLLEKISDNASEFARKHHTHHSHYRRIISLISGNKTMN